MNTLCDLVREGATIAPDAQSQRSDDWPMGDVGMDRLSPEHS